ncbi:HAMP domain-containing sensor histidine kinase [Anaerosporobacter sp.]
MGRLTIRHKIYIYSSAILLGLVLLCGIIIYLVNTNVDTLIHNRARVLMNNCIFEVNQGDYTSLEAYTYLTINLSGEVIHSNPKNMVQNKVDMKIVTGNSYGKKSGNYVYSAPILEDGLQVGTIYVEIPYEKLIKKSYFCIYVMAVTIIAVLVILIKFILFLHRDILLPIRQVHQSTKKIREGDFRERVRYDYDGEIGLLCHDFESLRDELDYSIQNERLLKEKEKLLLAYISHDLRTPIATISGYVEGIHTGLVKDERVQEYTSIILKKITMLNGLIDDILEHSKAQLHEFDIHKTECYSRDFFTGIVEELRGDIMKKGLEFRSNEIPNLLINIDQKRILQVLQNLVGNAMKFTEKGTIAIQFRYESEKLFIAVLDTGVGISATDQSMIFEPFYRGEKARTLNVPGSGLGLSISQYIVTQHGGRIFCDSVLDEGTTMEFYIPVA